MSSQPPHFSAQGDIHVDATVTGKVVVIGHGNQVNFNVLVRGARDATLQFDPQHPLLQELNQMLSDGSAQANILQLNGLPPGIVAPCLRAEDLLPGAPFTSPLGIPAPFTGNANLIAQNFASLDRFLQQLDQQFHGTLTSVSNGQQSLNLSELLLQKGNLALWRFREGALHLFAEQASLFTLAEPQQSTQLATFQAAARSNLDILRGWMIFQKYRTHQPQLIDQAAFVALNQGQWQRVLESWGAAQRLTQDQLQGEALYLRAVGQRYDPQAVQSAAHDAERYFTEALRRQPEQSAALINLAALLSERALLLYIETGTPDRPTLERARTLFQQAQALLKQRPDRDGQIALAQCLLYEATSLPPDARLEIVQWASSQAQQLQVQLSGDASAALRWDIAQRNLARRDPQFFDWKKFQQARDILVSAGAIGLLLTLTEQWLNFHAQATAFSQGGAIVAQAAHGASVQSAVTHGTMKVARHGITHAARHFLGTALGKAVAIIAVTVVVGASATGIILAHHSPFASAYLGTAHNTTRDASGAIVFTSFALDQQKISGKVFWGFPLVGNGSFTGTLGKNNNFTFTEPPTVSIPAATQFQGTLHADGSLSGTYGTSLGSQTGTWQVKPYQPAQTQLAATYHGVAQNFTVGGNATLALTTVVQKQQQISGSVVFGPGLTGNGKFSGTIGTDDSVTFIDDDTSDGFTITFSGYLFPDGSLSGSYDIPSSGQIGNWQVKTG